MRWKRYLMIWIHVLRLIAMTSTSCIVTRNHSTARKLNASIHMHRHIYRHEWAWGRGMYVCQFVCGLCVCAYVCVCMCVCYWEWEDKCARIGKCNERASLNVSECAMVHKLVWVWKCPIVYWCMSECECECVWMYTGARMSVSVNVCSYMS